MRDPTSRVKPFDAVASNCEHAAPASIIGLPMTKSASDLFIVDNSDANWKVASYLSDWCDLPKAIDIATGYFEMGAPLGLKEKWQAVDRVRILMGDEAYLRTRRAFAEGLRRLRGRLDGTNAGTVEWDSLQARV